MMLVQSDRPVVPGFGGRIKTLTQTGQMLWMLGYSSRPVPPYKVLRIEQRALRKLKKALSKIC